MSEHEISTGAAEEHSPETLLAEENKLIAERRDKLSRIRAAGNAFPNDFRRDASAAELQVEYAEKEADQ